jgi:hypothetical protein
MMVFFIKEESFFSFQTNLRNEEQVIIGASFYTSMKG